MNALRMHMYSKSVILILVVLLLLFSVVAYLNSSGRQVIRTSDGSITSFRDMVEEISDAKVIYIGEHHDNPAHHKTQLDVIRALYEKGRRVAIGLEMFDTEYQESLDAWVSGGTPESDFIPLFLERWGIGWELYRDIFLFAKVKGIPLVALNVPEEITRTVGKTGFLSLSDQQRKKLPPGVTCELDQHYMDHLVQIFQYKGGTDSSFVYFCEAQVLWDQAMAWYLTEYAKNNPDRTVIVLAGAIHTWRYGIPRQYLRYNDVEQRVILPDLPAGQGSIDKEIADYVVIHG